VGWALARRFVPLPLHFSWPAWTPELKSGLKFGLHFLMPNLLGNLRAMALPTIVGASLGMAAVGTIERATFFAQLPTSILSGIQTKIIFSYTARFQTDPAHVRTILRQTVAVTSLVDKLMFLPLLLFAHQAVNLLLGPGWLHIVPLFYVLVIGQVVGGPLMYSSFPVLNAIGKSSVISFSAMVTLAVTWLSLPLLTRHFGVMGYGYMMQIHYLLIPYYYFEIRRAVGSAKVLPAVLPPLLATAVTVAAGQLFVRWHAGALGWPVIIAACLVGSALYLGLAYVLNRGQFHAIIAFVRNRNAEPQRPAA
jgi:O-antigen/teichoic acid export membrane protein